MLRDIIKSWRENDLHIDPQVKEAFLAIDRSRFVLDEFKELAYQDIALPLIAEQTISQPTTIAIMIDVLQIKKGMRVLEVGAGSGYVAALLSYLVGKKGHVYAVEMRPELARLCENNVREKNVSVILANGYKGLPDKAPFDRIIVSAAANKIPGALIEQLAIGGILVIPIGDTLSQTMTILTKNEHGVHINHCDGIFQFVPLKKV